MDGLLCYCRQGFEPELAAELGERAALAGWPGYAKAEHNAGYVQFFCEDGAALSRALPWRELIALYQHADGFVFPSLYEGFGLPVLEAMRAGAPVLTTREAAIPEIGGETVLYADGRDEAAFAAALRAATALPPAERARLVAAARQRAAGFTWDASAEKLWYVLKQVARSPND